MIQLSGAGKRYGHKLLFENLDWLITPRDRLGLVGANGTGKSTLMKVLAGLETLDYGAVTTAKGISAGYLPQDGLTLSGRSIFAECMAVFSELRAMEGEMEHLTRQMSELDHESPQYSQVADRFHRLEHEFRTRDGYAIEAQVGTVLSGLGFQKEDWVRHTEEFSGGWQMRIALAKLLLQEPNLLLLDEPTNHLDLEARNWLEQYLGNYPHAFILISHDRYFLNKLVDHLFIFEGDGTVSKFNGNYLEWRQEKEQEDGRGKDHDRRLIRETVDADTGGIIPPVTQLDNRTWRGASVNPRTRIRSNSKLPGTLGSTPPAHFSLWLSARVLHASRCARRHPMRLARKRIWGARITVDSPCTESSQRAGERWDYIARRGLAWAIRADPQCA